MNEQQIIQLKEFQRVQNIYLSKDTYKGLQQSFNRAIQVTPTMEEDNYHLTGNSMVGVFEYKDTIIYIKPKVDISVIWDWLAVAYDLKSFRFMNPNIGFEETFGNLEWIVKSFIQECQKIYSRGIKKGYITQEEAIRSIRGQWKPQETFNRWLTYDYQFDCRFDELTENVKENQLIAATLKNMMLKKYNDSGVSRDCKELFNLFGKELNLQEMSRKKNPNIWIQELDKVPRTRLNAYYDDAFRWAKMYWKATSLSFELGQVKSKSFLLDMNELFEVYIGKLLIQKLKDFGIRVTLQNYDTLAKDGKIRIIPDIIVKSQSGREVVIDTKYIVRRDESSINSNVFQMLAYLTARRANDGILLYAGGAERVDQIKNSDFNIHQWSLHLDRGLSKEDIQLRIENIVERLLVLLQKL